MHTRQLSTDMADDMYGSWQKSVPMHPRDDFQGQGWMHPSMQSPMHWMSMPQAGQHLRTAPMLARQEPAQVIPYAPDDFPSDRGQQRATRAQQACVNCRQKKTRCNESRPRCSQCEMTDSECLYNSENIPTKRQLSFMDVTDRLERVEIGNDRQEATLERMEHVLHTFGDSLNALNMQYSRMMAEMQAYVVTTVERAMKGTLDTSSLPQPNAQLAMDISASLVPQMAPAASSSAAATSSVTEVPGSMPISCTHAGPAHKMILYWSSIKPFYRTVGEKDYVTTGEHSRPTILQSLGKKRARAQAQSALTALPILSSHSHGVPVDSPCGVSSSFPGASFTTVSPAPSPALDASFPSNTITPPNLSLTSSEAKACFEAYLQHMHILHPFIDAPRIQDVIDQVVVDRQLESVPMQRNFSSNSAQSLSGKKNLKRKMSPAGKIFSPVSTTVPNAGKPRTAETAIAMLVVALGKVYRSVASPCCDVPHQSAHPSGSAAIPDIYGSFYLADSFTTPAPHQNSFFGSDVSPTHSFANYEPKDPIGAGMSGGPGGRANHEVEVETVNFPGMHFYSHATQILGELVGERKLPYVHALLLAGLYCAALVRPVESAQWINMAATVMQTILSLNRQVMDPQHESDQADAIRLTYWTCLQLEGDLLAELDLPSSGIFRQERMVPFPKGPIHHGALYNFDCEEIMWYYSMQIWLRRLLNQSHSGGTYESNDGLLAPGRYMEMLRAWKQDLSRQDCSLAWDDSQPPAADMNAALMRGKYYSACYIINRPALLRAMTHQEKLSDLKVEGAHDAKWEAMKAFPSVRTWDPVSNEEAFEIAKILGIDQETMDGCRQCVDAAIRSTEAFDGLKTMPGRLNVTNVFGTAQAQFSNMLVLAAVARSNYLYWLIPGQAFKRLLHRTMTFVGQLAVNSPTMATNLEVLREVERLTILSPSLDSDVSSATIMGLDDALAAA